MKEFVRLPFDAEACRVSLDAFDALLASKPDLEENADIKPFFEAHPRLALLLGVAFGSDIASCDLCAYQFSLFGDFACDAVVGDSVQQGFVLVEWEDGTAVNQFRIQAKKTTPEWATRLEHGFSQIIDWFWKLEDLSRSDDFAAKFGSRHAKFTGVLVIGRDIHLTHPRERSRWNYRGRMVSIDSRPVMILTYDQLYSTMRRRFDFFFSRS